MTESGNHKQLMRQFFDAVNRRRLEEADELIANEFVAHNVMTPASVNDRKGFIAFLGALITAFPDLELAVSEMIADGEKVVSWVAASGTHRGDFLGVAATSAFARWDVVHCTTIRNNKIAEDRIMVDQFALLKALGAVTA